MFKKSKKAIEKTFRKTSVFGDIKLKSETDKGFFTEAQTISFAKNGKEVTKVRMITFVNMSTGDIYMFDDEGGLDIVINILKIPEAIENLNPEEYDITLMSAVYNHIYRRYSPIIPYINPTKKSKIKVPAKVC